MSLVSPPLLPEEQTAETGEEVRAEELLREEEQSLFARWNLRSGLRRRIFQPNKILLALASLLLLMVVLWAFFPSAFTGGSPTALGMNVLHAPSLTYPLGTDQYGRSVYTELVYGARSALEIGFFSTALALIIGSSMGILAGFFGGWVDMFVMRVIDILMAIPGLLLALIVVAALAPTLTNLILAVAVSSLAAYARVLRGQSLQVRSRLYVDAAKVLGVPRWKILLRHIIPNCLAPALVLGAIGFGTAIVIGAALAYLGLGPTSGILNWGALVNSGQNYINKEWWITTFPGLIITLVVIAVNIIGDWLRDFMEPSSR